MKVLTFILIIVSFAFCLTKYNYKTGKYEEYDVRKTSNNSASVYSHQTKSYYDVKQTGKNVSVYDYKKSEYRDYTKNRDGSLYDWKNNKYIDKD